jgi:hypothetical protein
MELVKGKPSPFDTPNLLCSVDCSLIASSVVPGRGSASDWRRQSYYYSRYYHSRRNLLLPVDAVAVQLGVRVGVGEVLECEGHHKVPEPSGDRAGGFAVADPSRVGDDLLRALSTRPTRREPFSHLSKSSWCKGAISRRPWKCVPSNPMRSPSPVKVAAKASPLPRFQPSINSR